MNINDLGPSAHVRLTTVLNQLVEYHQVRLDFTRVSLEELDNIFDRCEANRQRVVESNSHNTHHMSESYSEAGLIQEAITIFLSEVAPKRLNRRRKSNTALGANNE